MTPLLPGHTIGVLGGGQLGRMLTLEARRMGYRIVSWTDSTHAGPADVADEVITDSFPLGPLCGGQKILFQLKFEEISPKIPRMQILRKTVPLLQT